MSYCSFFPYAKVLDSLEYQEKTDLTDLNMPVQKQVVLTKCGVQFTALRKPLFIASLYRVNEEHCCTSQRW